MSVTVKDSVSKEDNVNNNSLGGHTPLNDQENKTNNDLKNRLRRYIKKLDGIIYSLMYKIQFKNSSTVKENIVRKPV